MNISVIVRTYNEQLYLPELLDRVDTQNIHEGKVEVVVVDSGSTDRTLQIAAQHNCKIVHIDREAFSFGRSLNIGCTAASGEYLVFISGHCVPASNDWLQKLMNSFESDDVRYTYGRQIGSDKSKFSEHQIFDKYYPEKSRILDLEFFANNANSAIKRQTWEKYRFNESLTGLEDLDLAKRLIVDGNKLAYAAGATVVHHHRESWAMIKRRYEREAIALQHIHPEIHISFGDFLRYLSGSILLDSGLALKRNVFWRNLPGVIMFRLMQFWGAYRGNHEHRIISRRRKEKYFYPK